MLQWILIQRTVNLHYSSIAQRQFYVNAVDNSVMGDLFSPIYGYVRNYQFVPEEAATLELD